VVKLLQLFVLPSSKPFNLAPTNDQLSVLYGSITGKHGTGLWSKQHSLIIATFDNTNIVNAISYRGIYVNFYIQSLSSRPTVYIECNVAKKECC